MPALPCHDLAVGPISSCQLCASGSLELVIDLGHQPPCDSLLSAAQVSQPERTFPLRLVRCTACGAAQIDYVVAAQELFYPSYPYRSGITPTLAANLRATASGAVRRYGLGPKDLAVDIGSNDGTLLSGFQACGLRVLGVEPTDIARIAIDAGIPTLQRFFDEETSREIRSSHGEVAIVTAANMFAHVAQLGGLIRGVSGMLRDNGLFITESHYLPSLLATVQYDSIYHEHLKYYTVRDLIRLFGYHGFSVTEIEKIENYGGSVRVHARKGTGHPPGASVAATLAEEDAMGLTGPAPFLAFAQQVRAARLALQDFALRCRREGRSLVGVGCPGRASTLVNYSALDRDLMPYIAEQSTSLKLGLHLPGTHQPVVDERVMLEQQPDYALLLSWHYWQPIVRKLREKGLRSRIVIPLPELQIIE